MSSTTAILVAVQAMLSEKFTDWSVELVSENPADYYLAHPTGGILVGYLGSKFGERRSSSIITQSRTVQIAIAIISRNLHDDSGALNCLDALRLAIVGFSPPNCTECYLIAEQFVETEEGGIWQYNLIVQTETVQIQQTNASKQPTFRQAIGRMKGKTT